MFGSGVVGDGGPMDSSRFRAGSVKLSDGRRIVYRYCRGLSEIDAIVILVDGSRLLSWVAVIVVVWYSEDGLKIA